MAGRVEAPNGNIDWREHWHGMAEQDSRLLAEFGHNIEEAPHNIPRTFSPEIQAKLRAKYIKVYTFQGEPIESARSFYSHPPMPPIFNKYPDLGDMATIYGDQVARPLISEGGMMHFFGFDNNAPLPSLDFLRDTTIACYYWPGLRDFGLEELKGKVRFDIPSAAEIVELAEHFPGLETEIQRVLDGRSLITSTTPTGDPKDPNIVTFSITKDRKYHLGIHNREKGDSRVSGLAVMRPA